MKKTISLLVMFSIFTSMLHMDKSLAMAEVYPASIKVLSNVQGALIYIDGDIAGVTPMETPVSVSPGLHKVKVRKEGETTTWRDDLFLNPGENAEIKAIIIPLVPSGDTPLVKRKKPFHKSWWFWTIVVAGIIFATDSSDSDRGSGSAAFNW